MNKNKRKKIRRKLSEKLQSSDGQALSKLYQFGEELRKELFDKYNKGWSPSPEELRKEVWKRHYDFCEKERIYASDGKVFLNPYESPIRRKLIRGNKPRRIILKSLLREGGYSAYKNDVRSLKRRIKRKIKRKEGYRKVCPICKEEFKSVRFDAQICPKPRCKKAAQRKKVTSSSNRSLSLGR
jgi:hypothetical protein